MLFDYRSYALATVLSRPITDSPADRSYDGSSQFQFVIFGNFFFLKAKEVFKIITVDLKFPEKYQASIFILKHLFSVMSFSYSL